MLTTAHYTTGQRKKSLSSLLQSPRGPIILYCLFPYKFSLDPQCVTIAFSPSQSKLLFWSERGEIALQRILSGFTTVLPWAVWIFMCVFPSYYCFYHLLFVLQPSFPVTYRTGLARAGVAPAIGSSKDNSPTSAQRELCPTPKTAQARGEEGVERYPLFSSGLGILRSSIQTSSSKCPVIFHEAPWSPMSTTAWNLPTGPLGILEVSACVEPKPLLGT